MGAVVELKQNTFEDHQRLAREMLKQLGKGELCPNHHAIKLQDGRIVPMEVVKLLEHYFGESGSTQD
jgi:hypothetical protein